MRTYYDKTNNMHEDEKEVYEAIGNAPARNKVDIGYIERRTMFELVNLHGILAHLIQRQLITCKNGEYELWQ